MRITNRNILLCVSLAAYIGQNQYYGWNAKPMSDTELWWDNFCIITFVFSLFVTKMTLVITRRRSE